jgi:hypothetical protein
LDHPLAGWMSADPAEVDPPVADLDEEEDIEASQPDRLDYEEVGGQDRVRVLAHEVRPGALAAARSGRDAAAAKDLGDAHVGDSEAALEHLALDSSVAPAWVLPGQPEDEFSKFRIALSTTRWPAAVSSPLSANELPVPAKQSLRARQEGGLARSREQPIEGREDQAIGGLPGRPASLTIEDSKLVSESEHLGAELSVGAEADKNEIGEESDEGISEVEEHGPDRGVSRGSSGGHRPRAHRGLRRGRSQAPRSNHAGGYTAHLPVHPQA